jgi:hypothetical protein
MRRGINRLSDINSSVATVTRGDGTTRKVRCRVSYQSGAVWNYAGVDGGANITTTPYVLAKHNADIREGDMLQWRNRRFQAGVVTYPAFGGGETCLQAQLREVQP